MRLRNIPGSEEAVAKHPACIPGEPPQPTDPSEIFGNNHPLSLEIGMGKGRFVTTLAHAHPEINYIGIERYHSVLYRALQKYDEAPLSNLRFLCIDAKDLEIILPAGSVQRIYLNFSDPWPKERHAKRRLTSPGYLSIYEKLLPRGATVELKTDNEAFFDYSIEQIEACGWRITALSRDLHADVQMCAGNVMTEYEERFSAAGNPIFKVIFTK